MVDDKHPQGWDAPELENAPSQYTGVMVRSQNNELIGTVHYNVKFKSGGLLNRLTAIEIYGLKPNGIEFMYLVEAKRNATPEEIRKLCKGTPKR